MTNNRYATFGTFAEPGAVATSQDPLIVLAKAIDAESRKLRTRTGPKAVVVAGNKRHYAVAIDTNNIEISLSKFINKN